MKPDEANRSTALDRALADLDRHDSRLAVHRLKSYLVDCPTSMEARSLLAHVYRLEGYADEAGRWGYLDPNAATDDERAAYERSCRSRRGRHWVATSTLTGLHWPLDAAAPSEFAARTLSLLTDAAAHEEAAGQAARNPAPLRIAKRAANHARRTAKEKARKARSRKAR